MRLRQIVGGYIYFARGGHEFDGKEINPLDEGEIRRIAEDIHAKEISSIAITSVFSPVNSDCERHAAEILEAELPGCHISLSGELGRIGLLPRENATILNACLRDLAEDITRGLSSALREVGILAPLYLSQNDGTLMDIDHGRRYPVLTFSSGATNSMHGAAFLTGLRECIVVDVGGTTTDIGALTRGFPREAPFETDIGGVRTNFRMPDLLSIGIGGGSLVRSDHPDMVGPDSVGHELTNQARVFGGPTLTATDLAVAAGLAEIGEPERVRSLDRTMVGDALRYISETVRNAADSMRSSRASIPLVVVGGGSILLPAEMDGFAAVIRPKHHAVANAIGTAIAQVGGEVDGIYNTDRLSREAILSQAKEEAAAKAVAVGASAETVNIVEVDEIPLTYLNGKSVRVRVKAVGELATVSTGSG